MPVSRQSFDHATNAAQSDQDRLQARVVVQGEHRDVAARQLREAHAAQRDAERRAARNDALAQLSGDGHSLGIIRSLH